MNAPIVVVGGGLAAGTAVTELREAGYDGDLVLFAEEHHVPYERPPLSKAVLRGEKPVDSAYVQAG
jgi:3-phenylpropionate/trans-cinnamate dioxygenase ferredoxin reductase subunit